MLPIIETERLILKPFKIEDAQSVYDLAKSYELYKSTLNIPHPYEPHMATEWIKTHEVAHEENGMISLGAFIKETDTLVGTFSLGHLPKSKNGEIGYWIGLPFWNKGYASEGAKALLDFGFSQLKLNRIYGRYLTFNPASRKVMEKIGLEFEGILREVIVKDGTFHDVGYLAMLRSDWLRQTIRSEVRLSVRRAEQKDASALSIIQRHAFEEDIERYGERSDCPAYETLERLEQKIFAFDYYVLEENGRIIGGAVMRPLSDDEMRLSRIYIEPRYHNLGVGKFFMQHLESVYPQMKTWGLDTPFKNFRNHHFYESLGYVKIGETKLDEVLTLFEYKKHI